MVGGPAPRRAFVLLLGAGHSRAAAQVLRTEAPGAVIVEPPVSGLGFFTADGDAGRALDEWYARTDLGEAPPNLLLWHDPELADWVHGTDAEFWVAAPDQEVADSYGAHPNVHAIATWDARELARRAAPPPTHPQSGPSGGAGGGTGGHGATDPFTLLAAAGPLGAASTSPSTAIIPVPVKPAPPRSGFLRRVRDRLRASADAGSGQTLGTLLIAAPPFCVAVLGRAGGAARTGSAASLAIMLAEAVRALSRPVALVDGHLGDSGAWAGLSLSGSPPTLETLVSALRDGRRPPSPGYGGLSSLQVYPDAGSQAGGYPPADLHRAAEHLRHEHLAVVVDLPPEVPETLDSTSTTSAAWLAEADATVIVAGSDQEGLIAVHGRLQAEVMRGKRVVLCLVGPGPRPGRERPEIVALFQSLRSHVARVAELPDDDAGTAALLRHGSGEPVQPATQKAYTRLAEVVIEVATAP
jgi:hypothetical protein